MTDKISNFYEGAKDIDNLRYKEWQFWKQQRGYIVVTWLLAATEWSILFNGEATMNMTGQMTNCIILT